MKRIEYWKINFGEEEIKKIRESILNRNISQGKVTEEFERRVSNYLDVKYCVATTNGSIAILMSLMALDIKTEDEVIIPNRTWIATAHAPMLLGAKPVLVDVLPDKPIIDISKIRKKITKKTKAIMPVHLNGRSADMTAINEISEEYNLPVIEESCQAFLSKNANGYLGAQSDMGCFSFAISKLFSTGQGGMVITNNKGLYEKLKLIRTHGTASIIFPKYKLLGFNFKFTDILASIGIVQLQKAKEKIEHAKKIYLRYSEGIKNLSSIKIIPSNVSLGEIPIYIETLAEDRAKLINFLNSKDIYPRPFLPNINSAPYIEKTDDFPNSDIFAKKGIFLPSGPDLPIEDVERVIEALKEFENINFNKY